jgi:NAD(P)H-nitrite reductase large subunit
MTDSPTYVCRCERITAEAVEQAIADGNLTVNDIKRRTRAGMGICQGIFCTANMADRLVAAGIESSEIAPMTFRPPTRIVPLGPIAANAKDKA